MFMFTISWWKTVGELLINDENRNWKPYYAAKKYYDSALNVKSIAAVDFSSEGRPRVIITDNQRRQNLGHPRIHNNH